MNPLQRRLFRLQQPGMSRQPMGILASSPEMMEAARRNMNQGPLPGYANGGLHTSNNMYLANTLKNPTLYGAGMLGDSRMSPAEINARRRIPTMSDDVDDELMRLQEIERAKQEAEANQFAVSTGSSPSVFPDVKKEKVALGPSKNESEEKSTSAGDTINQTNNSLLSTKPTESDDKPDDGGLSDMVGKQTAVVNKLRNNISNISKGVNFDQELTQASNNLDQRIQDLETAMQQQGKPLTLADVDQDFKQLMGYEPGDIATEAEEERGTAFWMGLMKAGLAMAAGESSNTITNIAKGLSFGLDSYGKDLNRINAQEKQDRKDTAKIRYDLLKDKKSEQVAARALDVQYKSNLVNIAQIRQKDARDAAKENLEREYNLARLDLSVMQSAQELGLKLGDQNIAQEKLDLLIQEQKSKYAVDPKLFAQASMLGAIEQSNPEVPIDPLNPDTYTITDSFKTIIENSLKNSTTMTDSDKTVASVQEPLASGFFTVSGTGPTMEFATADAAANFQRKNKEGFKCTKGADTIQCAEEFISSLRTNSARSSDINTISLLKELAKDRPEYQKIVNENLVDADGIQYIDFTPIKEVKKQ